MIYEPSATRDRITGRIHLGCNSDGVQVLNTCYAKVVKMAPVMKRLRDAKKAPQQGLEAGILSAAELVQITEMNDLVAQVVAVDDFTPKEFARYFKGPKTQKRAKPNPKAEAAE